MLSKNSLIPGSEPDKVIGRYFDDNGNPLTPEIQINSSIPYSQQSTSTAELMNGQIVVVWSGYNYETSSYDIVAKIIGTEGQFNGSEFVVNSFTPKYQLDPVVTALAGGGYVVHWKSEDQDGDDFGIYAQLFDENSQPVGIEFQVNTYTSWNQHNHDISALPDGGFIVVWQTTGYEGVSRVYVQRFDESGVEIGDEFMLTSFAWALTPQSLPSVSVDEDGGFIISRDAEQRYNDILFHQFSPTIKGTTFADIEIGTRQSDWFVGLEGDDRFFGRIGDDIVEGGAGNDLLRGGKGEDILLGGVGQDRLKGNAGNDILHGNAGNDILKGQDGNDFLLGGGGKDALRGGDGADVFVFTKVSDSPLKLNDRIMYFEAGLDDIDLSRIIADDFVFIDDNKFSGTQAEIRAVHKNENTIVKIDVDGDGSPDMKIFISGLNYLSESDFIL